MTDDQNGPQPTPEAIEEENKSAIGRIRELIREMNALSKASTAPEGDPGGEEQES